MTGLKRRSWRTPPTRVVCTTCGASFLRAEGEMRRMARMGMRPYCSVACSTKKGSVSKLPVTYCPPTFEEAAAACIARSTEPELNTGCLLWAGAVDPQGYGKATVQGQRLRAHRASWIAANGPFPANDLCVCHRCDTPSCVNPAHLFLGTHADNVADRVRKGRSYRKAQS